MKRREEQRKRSEEREVFEPREKEDVRRVGPEKRSEQTRGSCSFLIPTAGNITTRQADKILLQE